MINLLNYKTAFITALTLHVLLALLLMMDPSTERPVLKAEARNEAPRSTDIAVKPEEQAIKAVSVSSEEVMAKVKQLQAERDHARAVETSRQRQIALQAEAARKQRVLEQKRLENLKAESAKLAIARKKEAAAEQEKLKQLAKQKVAEEKRLAEMKDEQKKLQKQQDALKIAAAGREMEERLAKARELKIKEQQAAMQQAALDNADKARIAGVVDKYKALIINAIGQQWILPDNIDKRLSSQFRIRLAPNGTVLDVRLLRSSGDSILDRSAQSAIYKASPLPVPSDMATFNIFREISLTVRPENVRG